MTNLNPYLATVIAGDYRYYKVDFRNRFAQDPDGAGGLSDVDQDGYYDDLPANTDIVIVFSLKPTFSKDIDIPYSMSASHSLEYDKWSGERQSTGGSAQEAWYYVDTSGDKLVGPSDLVSSVRRSFQWKLLPIRRLLRV